mmetsp:Transcript_19726/g.37091  ORF Transcript_19726/g.37091 Transcript_19726/m.37091 type:complete len:265 (+) Transcript_19726:658-1452(+)
MTLAAIVHEERVLDVGLHHIEAFRLDQAQTTGRLGNDVHGRPPVSVGFFHEPWQVRGLKIRRWCTSPVAVLDNVRLRHLAGCQLKHLRLLFKPCSSFEIHCYSAEMRLICKIHQLLPQWAMIFIAFLILKPFLVWIHPPLGSLQQVLAEPLAMTPDLAVRAVPVPLLERLPICIERRRWRGLRVVHGHQKRLVINHLLHAGHFLTALLDLDVSLRQVLVHDALLKSLEPCSRPQIAHCCTNTACQLHDLLCVTRVQGAQGPRSL